MKKIGYFLCIGMGLIANPQNPVVMGGSAQFSELSSGVLEIASSNVAVIHWESFSIAIDEQVRFIQPGATSAVLNRVLGGEPSQLQGLLSANGSVYLLNPNGVFISPEAVIQTNNFLATTFEIEDHDFLSHDFSEGLFYVPPPLHPEDHPFAAAISHEGQFSANLVEERGGKFYLVADRVKISGSVKAPSGSVRLVGSEILLDGAAHIDVSGANPGTIEIGGGYQGKDPAIPAATHVKAAPNVLLSANGEGSADGGQIVVWSEEGTWFYGNAEARGGDLGGDGGLVEISGKQFLDYRGIADTRAPFGKTGRLLLDPINIAVTGANANNSGGPSIFYPTASPSTVSAATIVANLALTAVIVESSGATSVSENGDVTISSAIAVVGSPNDLTFRTRNLSTSPPVPAGNIIIGAAITNTGTGDIFFDAGGDITQTSAMVTTAGSIGYACAGNCSISAAGVLSGANITGSGQISVITDGDLTLTDSAMHSASLSCSLPGAGTIAIDIGGNLNLNAPTGGGSIHARGGLTVAIGQNLLMDSAIIDTVGGSYILDIGGFAFMNNSSLNGKRATMNIAGSFSMAGNSSIEHDTECALNIGGDLTLADDANIDIGGEVPPAGGPFNLNVGGEIYASGLTSINATEPVASFRIQAGRSIQLIGGAKIASPDPARPLYIEAGLDFIADGIPGDDAGIGEDGGPTTIVAGRDFILQGAAVIDTQHAVTLDVTAGRSIKILNASLMTTTGNIQLICDEDNSNPPEIGSSSSFVKASGASIDTNGGLLLIYTAARNQNVIQGNLNGIPFIPGPEFVNTATEMWGIYAPHNSGIPFTVFYKNIFIPKAALNAFNVAYYDYLQNLARFDRLFFVLKQYQVLDLMTMVQPLFWPNNPLWVSPDLYLDPEPAVEVPAAPEKPKTFFEKMRNRRSK